MIRQLVKIILCSLLFCAGIFPANAEVRLNDIHSQLNTTQVDHVFTPKTISEIQSLIRKAKENGKSISISGGKHSMGGQQFGAGTIHINMSSFDKVIDLNAEKGIVEVQSGIQWPALIDWLLKNQKGQKQIWGIRQKQTGADRLSIGGALSSNIHGRGLRMRPVIDVPMRQPPAVELNRVFVFCSSLSCTGQRAWYSTDSTTVRIRRLSRVLSDWS